MGLELSPEEVVVLLQILDAAHRDRLERIRKAGAPETRTLIEAEARIIADVRARLAREAEAREAMIDESIEATFPASDPPARSSAPTL